MRRLIDDARARCFHGIDAVSRRLRPHRALAVADLRAFAPPIQKRSERLSAFAHDLGPEPVLILDAQADAAELEQSLRANSASWVVIWLPAPGSDTAAWSPAASEVHSAGVKAGRLQPWLTSNDVDAWGRQLVVFAPVSRTLSTPWPVSALRGREVRFYYTELTDSRRYNPTIAREVIRALTHAGARVTVHDFNDPVARADAQTILLGHPGRWISGARASGAGHVVMYAPASTFQPTRNDPNIEAEQTVLQQYDVVDGAVFHSGTHWRYGTGWPRDLLRRFVVGGLHRAWFPRRRRRFSRPGKRRFLFVNLYNDEEKGAHVAAQVARALPATEFFCLGVPLREPNVRNFGVQTNTFARFSQLVAKCDALLTPSLSDAGPGTVLECVSLGLLPVCTAGSGHVMSYPRLIEDASDIHAWVEALDVLQRADEDTLQSAWDGFDAFIDRWHGWERFHEGILNGLCDILANPRRPTA